jgi:DNA-binding NarL/FixJ family response regulator
MRLLAEGCGTAAVAERLVISASTARNHIQNILDKLRVHSRMEAVIFGIRQGLIVPAHDKHDSLSVLGREPDL